MAAAKKSSTSAFATVGMSHKKDTPNTHRYETDDDTASMRNVYVKKSALNGGRPDAVTVGLFPRLKSKKQGALVQVNLDHAKTTKGGWTVFRTDDDDAGVTTLYAKGEFPSEVTLVVTAG